MRIDGSHLLRALTPRPLFGAVHSLPHSLTCSTRDLLTQVRRWRLREVKGESSCWSWTCAQRHLAPLFLGVSAGGRRLNGRGQSPAFYVSHPCDKMRQSPCLGCTCGLVVRTEFKIRERKNVCDPQSVPCQPQCPRRNDPCIGP